MFRTTVTITHPTLTFSTTEEYITELEKYYSVSRYNDALNLFSDSMVIGNKTLVDSSTMDEVFDWQDEETYIEFYSTGTDILDSFSSEGFIRTITTEII